MRPIAAVKARIWILGLLLSPTQFGSKGRPGVGGSPLAWGDEVVGDVAEFAFAVLGLAAEQVEGFGAGQLVSGDEDADGLVDDAAGVQRFLQLRHQRGVLVLAGG